MHRRPFSPIGRCRDYQGSGCVAARVPHVRATMESLWTMRGRVLPPPIHTHTHVQVMCIVEDRPAVPSPPLPVLPSFRASPSLRECRPRGARTETPSGRPDATGADTPTRQWPYRDILEDVGKGKAGKGKGKGTVRPGTPQGAGQGRAPREHEPH